MEVPARFGGYEPLFKLGHGGMAEVLVAQRTGEAGFHRLVAIKRMLPHLAEDPHLAAMFLDEARLASHIASPHVVQTLDLGRSEDGAPYIVMQLVVGVDVGAVLTELAERRALVPVDVAVELVAQAAIGLHDAHEARTPEGRRLALIHRDVSPSNLLLGVDGRVRVSDFGVAWAEERSTRTVHGERKGKYGYFSPEQGMGGELDRRSDVFALGIVAWEILCVRPLFAPSTAAEALEVAGEAAIPPLSAFRDDVPPAIEAAVRRALRRSRDERFDTARELADALRDAAHDAGLEPSDTRVAELLAELRPPRLAALMDRLRRSASSSRAPPRSVEEEITTSIHDAPTRIVVSERRTEEGTTVPSEET